VEDPIHCLKERKQKEISLQGQGGFFLPEKTILYQGSPKRDDSPLLVHKGIKKGIFSQLPIFRLIAKDNIVVLNIVALSVLNLFSFWDEKKL
jgi:hypothetical protein